MKWLKTLSFTRSNRRTWGLLLCLDINDEQALWDIYNTIREAESSFRASKQTLTYAPYITNQIMEQLHICILTFSLLTSHIRYQLKQKKFNSSWKEIVRIGNTQKVITTSGQNQHGITIATRKCSEANQSLSELYKLLNIQNRPFVKRKSVVHKSKLKKNQDSHLQNFPP